MPEARADFWERAWGFGVLQLSGERVGTGGELGIVASRGVDIEERTELLPRLPTIGARADLLNESLDPFAKGFQPWIGGNRLGDLVEVRGDSHVGADALVGASVAVDLVAAVAAVLTDQVVALDELRRGGLGKPLRGFEIDHLMMALQAARLLEPVWEHRLDPVMVVEPPVLVMPLVSLNRRIGGVRGPLEARCAPLPLMADRAAESLHRVGAGRSDEEIETRVSGVGLRDAAPDRELERPAPLRRPDERRDSGLARERLAAVDAGDDIPRHQAGHRGRRSGDDKADRRIGGVEQTVGGEVEAVELLELGVAIPLDGRREGARLGGCRERDGDVALFAVGRLGGGTGERFVHSLVAGNAPVEARDIAEIIIECQLRKPDLVDPQRSVEGIEDRQFKQCLAGVRSPVLERLCQLSDLVAMVSEILRRGILDRRDVAERRFEGLAMSVGGLVGLDGLDDLPLLRLGDRFEGVETRLGRILGDGQFVVGPALIKLRLPEFQLSGEVVLTELRSLGDVAHSLDQVATDRQSLTGIGLRHEPIDVGLDEIGGNGVFVDRPGPLEKRRRQRRGDCRAAGVGEGRLEFGGLCGVGLGGHLRDPGRCRPRFEFAEALLVFLPGPVVVGREHRDCR